MIVTDDLGYRVKNKVSIFDVGNISRSRLSRMTTIPNKILKKAMELNCDIYHLDDLELIPVGLKLKKLGKKVIFDSHENVSQDILSKEWIPKFLRKFISVYYPLFKKYM